jgi:hypothetical protein
MAALPEPTDPLNTSPNHPTPGPVFPSPSSMTTPTTTDQPAADIERWRTVFYNSAIGLCVLSPAVMLLPPRKLDLYTLGLGVTFFMSAGYVSEVRTGHGLLWHVGRQLPAGRQRAREEADLAELERGRKGQWMGVSTDSRGNTGAGSSREKGMGEDAEIVKEWRETFGKEKERRD